MKPRIRLRPVDAEYQWPLPPSPDTRTQAERLADAIAYLKARNIYVLQQGSKAPTWGVPQPGAKIK